VSNECRPKEPPLQPCEAGGRKEDCRSPVRWIRARTTVLLSTASVRRAVFHHSHRSVDHHYPQLTQASPFKAWRAAKTRASSVPVLGNERKVRSLTENRGWHERALRCQPCESAGGVACDSKLTLLMKGIWMAQLGYRRSEAREQE